MTIQERTHQEQRINAHKRLSAVADELTAALAAIKSDSTGPFTGNSSRVQSITGFTLLFDSGDVTVQFPNCRAVSGWRLSNALTPVLEEARARVWAEIEKI